MAWRCTRSELRAFLEGVGADRDEKGRFFLSWPQGDPGLGRPRAVSVVVTDDVRYRIRGYWAPLASALSRRSADTLGLWDGSTRRDQGAA
jgi:hypothetical protein